MNNTNPPTLKQAKCIHCLVCIFWPSLFVFLMFPFVEYGFEHLIPFSPPSIQGRGFSLDSQR